MFPNNKLYEIYDEIRDPDAKKKEEEKAKEKKETKEKEKKEKKEKEKETEKEKMGAKGGDKKDKK